MALLDPTGKDEKLVTSFFFYIKPQQKKKGVAVVNTADGEFKFKSFATQQVVFIISPMMGVDFQPSAEIEKGKNRNTVKSTPQKAKNSNRLFKYLH